MPQINVWDSTRALVGALARRLTAERRRAVKHNEIVEEALRAYAAQNGMSADDVASACQEPIPTRRRS